MSPAAGVFGHQVQTRVPGAADATGDFDIDRDCSLPPPPLGTNPYQHLVPVLGLRNLFLTPQGCSSQDGDSLVFVPLFLPPLCLSQGLHVVNITERKEIWIK